MHLLSLGGQRGVDMSNVVAFHTTSAVRATSDCQKVVRIARNEREMDFKACAADVGSLSRNDLSVRCV